MPQPESAVETPHILLSEREKLIQKQDTSAHGYNDVLS